MRRGRILTGATASAAAVALLAGCGGTPAAPQAPTPAPSSTAAASTRAVEQALQVPEGLAEAPYDTERAVFAPDGWTVSLWARLDGARLAAWTPDGRLLISRPESGDVQILTPGDDPADAPDAGVLVGGLRQPHGMAFDDDTLYIASSDRVDAWDYADGAVSNRRAVVEDLPDGSTGELRGAYAHALKSVVVGDDGAVYVSVGSTGNTSAEDRDATPERASVLRIEDGETETFASGVRNGTGLAVAPDGAVWTAVNHRDRVAFPWADGYLEPGRSTRAT